MLRGGLSTYRRSITDDRKHLLDGFDVVDVAHKIVGVGSVGLRAWVLLLLGRDINDPLVLQVKAVAEFRPRGPMSAKANTRNHGQRVVAGQRLQQAFTDIFLGWTRVVGLDGQTCDSLTSGSCATERAQPTSTVCRRTSWRSMRVCADGRSRGHARSGDRIAIASYLGPETF